MKQNQVEGVAGKLRLDEVRQGHGDALGRGKAVFAVQDHRVRAVEHDDSGAAGLVFRLADDEIFVVHVEGYGEALARHGVRQRGIHVEVERVAELVGLGGARGLDAGGLVAGIVPSTDGATHAAKQVAERLIAQKIHTLVGNLEAGVTLRRCGLVDLALAVCVVDLAIVVLAGLLLLALDVVLALHALHQVAQHLLAAFVAHVLVLLLVGFVQKVAGLHQLAQRLAQVLHGVLAIELLELREGILEARVEQEVGQRLHHVVESEFRGEIAGVLGVAGAFHV